MKHSKEILSLPNILTYIRFLMIPVIGWVSFVLEDNILSACLIAFSWLTDIADGFIARKFNMTTDLGKIIDPIADKLTQLMVILCLAKHYPMLYILLALMAVKEIGVGIVALMAMKKTKKVCSAKWYGKLSTGLFYISALIIVCLGEKLSTAAANSLIGLCCLSVVLSLVLYSRDFASILTAQKRKA